MPTPKPSTIIRLEMPASAGRKLLEGWKRKDPELMKLCAEFKIVDIQPVIDALEKQLGQS